MIADISASMRLWQLISPSLPIGAYAYSAGLEYAVEAGWVHDEKSACEWIIGQLENNLSRLDAPVFLRLYQAWQSHQADQLHYWNSIILALREAAELRQEDLHLGDALGRVLRGLEVVIPDSAPQPMAFACVFAFACQHWDIDKHQAVHGLLWSWAENQMAAAVKLVPLGQTSGQHIMSMAIPAIERSIQKALQCEDDDIGLLSPGLAIAGALHETQYTRLFRS